MANLKNIRYFLSFLFFMVLLTGSLCSQTAILNETFTNGFPTGWSASGEWQLKDIAKVDDGTYWNNRDSIISPSVGPGMVFDSDGAETLGTAPPHEGEIISDSVDCSFYTNVALVFYQYYRNFQSTTIVSVSNDGGGIWNDIVVNADIAPNVETYNANRQEIDISAFAAGESNVRIKFRFEGNKYFWIIDDISLIGNDVPIGTTLPPKLGDSLDIWGIPYIVDTLGGAAKTNEVITQFESGLSDAEKQTVRDNLQVFRYDTCRCPIPDIELWTLLEFVIDKENNMVFNGDFENGISDYFTSDLDDNCSCWPQTMCVAESARDKCTNTKWQEIKAPAGAGNFLIVDGLFQTGVIWESNFNFPVKKDSQYVFSMQLFPDISGDGDSPVLEIRVVANNGSVMHTFSNIEANEFGKWKRYDKVWTPQNPYTNVHLQIRQIDVAMPFNDYGIDDIYFGKPSFKGAIQTGPFEKNETALQQHDSEIQEIDPNYLVFNELSDSLNLTFDTLMANPLGTVPTPEDDIIIAILDTGVDFDHPDLTQFIWTNDDTPGNGDDDKNCYPNDFIGWNFADDNNNPHDNHKGGHGTHVAGIVKDNFISPPSGNCGFSIMPLKTHNKHGLSEIWQLCCASWYGAKNGAKVLNMSTGYYGETSEVFENVIRMTGDSFGIIAIVAAGNEHYELIDDVLAYPACYTSLNNMITVTSVTTLNLATSNFELDGFSNFSGIYVDIGASGKGISSTMPLYLQLPNNEGLKDGTSMATPAVAGKLAGWFCCNDFEADSFGVICLIDDSSSPASPSSNLTSAIKGGTVLNLVSIDCSLCVGVDVIETEKITPKIVFSVSPNPVENLLTLKMETALDAGATLHLVDLSGRESGRLKMDKVFCGEKITLSLEGLAPGNYFIAIQQNGYIWTQKILKI